jgi:hypothetical protein
VTGGEGSKTVTTKANSLAVLGMSINVTLARYVSLGLTVGLGHPLMAPADAGDRRSRSVDAMRPVLPVDPMRPDWFGR